MSVPCRISVPPARANPSTAAITGLVGRYVLSQPSKITPGSRASRSSNSSSGAAPLVSLPITPRSIPAQKFPPAPVRMQARRSASSSSRRHASLRPHRTSASTAFFLSGLLIVTTSTCSDCSQSSALPDMMQTPPWPRLASDPSRSPMIAGRRPAHAGSRRRPGLAMLVCPGRLRCDPRGGYR